MSVSIRVIGVLVEELSPVHLMLDMTPSWISYTSNLLNYKTKETRFRQESCLNRIDDSILALAGVFQSAYLVTKIARNGVHPLEGFECCINSLFVFEAPTTLDVYQDMKHLMSGLRVTSEILELSIPNLRPGETKEIMLYGMTLLHLERKLAKEPAMLRYIGERLREISRQKDFFSVSHDTVIQNIADIYTETISQLGLRIQIKGEKRFLNIDSNAHKLRALLLAGIRSAILWRQLGGRRWQLLFKRRALIQAVNTNMNLV